MACPEARCVSDSAYVPDHAYVADRGTVDGWPAPVRRHSWARTRLGLTAAPGSHGSSQSGQQLEYGRERCARAARTTLNERPWPPYVDSGPCLALRRTGFASLGGRGGRGGERGLRPRSVWHDRIPGNTCRLGGRSATSHGSCRCEMAARFGDSWVRAMSEMAVSSRRS